MSSLTHPVCSLPRALLASTCALGSFLIATPAYAVLDLYPPIPESTTNPFVANMWSGLQLGVTTATFNETTNQEVRIAAYAYLHPQGTHRGEQAALDRLLLLLDTNFAAYDPTSGVIPVGWTNYVFQSYYMLKVANPSAIPADKKAKWEGIINGYIPTLLARTDWGPHFAVNSPLGGLWLNGEMAEAAHLYFGGLAVGNHTWARLGRATMERNYTRMQLGDGATHYYGYQNEVPNYHNVSLQCFLEYWLWNRAPEITNIFAQSRLYCGLGILPYGGGFHEWTTVPSWKTMYNNGLESFAPAITSFITGDPYAWNQGSGASTQSGLKSFYTFNLAFIYKSGLTTQPYPDNYTVYDRNIQGGHSRYANWGVAFNGRNVQWALPELLDTDRDGHEGKHALAGAYIVNSPSTATNPLNAAFHGSAPQIKVKAGTEPSNTTSTTDAINWGRGNVWNFLTRDEEVATTRSNSVQGIANNYTISKSGYGVAANNAWTGQQQWIMTPDRLVGMCEIKSSATSTLYGLSHRIELVGGRNQTGANAKTIQQIDANTFNYGKLNVKVHGKDYAGPVSTFKFGIAGSQTDEGSTMIELHDINSATDSSTTFAYPAGTARYALVECTHDGLSFAAGAARLTGLASGLQGFEFTENANRKVRLVHNTTTAAITYTASLASPYAQTRLLKSWDVDTFSSLSVSSGSTAVSISIPANQHITLINSSIADDHTGTYKHVENVYSGYDAIRDGWIYQLQPKHAPDSRLDVTAGGTTNGTLVKLSQRTGANNQQWRAEQQADGSFELIPLNFPAARLDINAGSSANGSAAIIMTDTNASSQHWRVLKQDEGYVELAPLNAPNSRLEVASSSMADGTPVQISADTNASNQRWKLIGAPSDQIPVGPAAIPAPTYAYDGPTTFDGVATSVNAGTVPGSASALTVAFVMTPSKVAYMIPVDKEPTSGTAGWTVKLRNNGDLWFRVGGNPTGTYTDTKVTGVYTTGLPVHVACTFAAGTAKVYINGILCSTTTGITQTVNDTVTSLRLGAPSVSATGEKYAGTLSGVKIYATALNDAQIDILANQ